MSVPCTPGMPPNAGLYFFPGTKGDKGDKGDTGAPSTVPGPEGPAGGVGVYTGPYVAGTTYYDTAVRKDIVFYNGRFWITDNAQKSGLTSWSAPTVADWEDFGLSLIAVATKLMLNVGSDIAVGLNWVSPGYAKSNNFVQYVSGWILNASGRVEAYDVLLNGLFSTDTQKFHLASPTRTMPSVGSAQLDIAAIVDGDIPENPTINVVTDDALIFFGWLQGDNNFITNRFGNVTQNFAINLNGVGENNSGGNEIFYIQIYYRTRVSGGAWGAWTVIGQDWYMNKLAGLAQPFDLNREPTIGALTGNHDVQFGAGFSKGVGGTVSVAGAQITVKAFN